MRRRQLNSSRWSNRFKYYMLTFSIVAALNSLSFMYAKAGGPLPTEQEKKACIADVFRLCSWAIPDANAITSCLKSNVAGVSAECRLVLSTRERPSGVSK